MATVEHCLYCLEALAADLEKRDPMTLYQVQSSWADYPKGLEEADDPSDNSGEEEDENGDDNNLEGGGPSSETSDAEANKSTTTTKRPKLTSPTLQRLAPSSSTSTSTTGASTPSSASSTSLAPSSVATTPPSSSYAPSPSFRPVGIGRITSQRSHPGGITASPLFVTWNKLSPSGSRLRGCIGTFETLPLASGLSSYALTSALQDTRFAPITLAELPTLEVAVTLLTDFEPCADAMDWELGVHGLKISFYHHHRRLGATYLPDVAVEQGWGKEETLVSLMRKAGWGGKRDKWREVADLKVVRYQGKKESVEWDEYRRWREWVEAGKKGKGAE